MGSFKTKMLSIFGFACALVLALTLIPSVASAASANDFKDLDKKAWYMTDGWVPYVLENELMSGYKGTKKFGPYDNISRGQVVVILYRYDNNKTEKNTNNDVSTKFSDVKSGQYYSAAVDWATKNNIVTGYKGTKKFGPNDPVTREQLATIIARFAEYKGKTIKGADDSIFKSLKGYKNTSDWAKEGVIWCTANKVISGESDIYLNPQGNAWRASMAKIVNVLVEDVIKGNNSGSSGANKSQQAKAKGQVEFSSLSTNISRNNQYFGDQLVSYWTRTSIKVKKYSGPLDIVVTAGGQKYTTTIDVTKNTSYNLTMSFNVNSTVAEYGGPPFYHITYPTRSNSYTIEAGGASQTFFHTLPGTFINCSGLSSKL